MLHFLKSFGREMSRNIAVVAALGGVAAFAFAFTEPTVGPTDGSVNAPVNVGGTAQRKTGSLSVGAGGAGVDDVTINTAGGVTAEGTVTGNILNTTSQICFPGDCRSAWPAGGGSSVGAAGTVQFSNGSSGFNGDAANFFWDNTNDRLGIRTAAPSTNLHVVGGVRVTGLASCNTIDTDASGNFVCGTDDAGAGGGVTGSGSTNYMPKWTGASSLGNSQIYDNGSVVSIGGISTEAKFIVVGDAAVTGGRLWIRGNVAPPSVFSGSISLGNYTIGGYGYLQSHLGKLVLNPLGNNVGVGVTNPSFKLDVAGDFRTTGRATLSNGSYGSAYGVCIGDCQYSLYSLSGALYLGSSIGPTVIPSGNVGIGVSGPSWRLQLSVDSAGKPNGGSWGNSSDERLKTDIAPLTGALEKLTALRGVQFEWKNPEEHASYAGERRAGFIAQDVEKIFPQFVGEIDANGKDKELIADGKVKTLTLPFDFDAYVVEAMKELKAEVNALKSENAILKARVEALEKR